MPFRLHICRGAKCEGAAAKWWEEQLIDAKDPKQMQDGHQVGAVLCC